MFRQLLRPVHASLRRVTAQSYKHQSSVKQAREARRATTLGVNQPTISKGGMSVPTIALLALVGISAGLAYDVKAHPDGFLGQQYHGSALQSLATKAYDATLGNWDSIYEPSCETWLIPHWPEAPCYGNPPPGTPAPPLLVLDVERTLVGSIYDAKHGWRHVKRPGLDKFLKALTQYYEVVLFSENDIGVASDILIAIDPEGMCHKLGAAAAEARGQVMLKRLDLMGRDLSRIVLIDDSEESSQLCPRNTLIIKPFVNIGDTTDRALDDLIPLLHALVHDEVGDFRLTLDDLGTHEADEAVTEYRMRLAEKKQAQDRKRNVGLGGVIRSKINADREALSEAMGSRSTILSPSQIVGGLQKDTGGSLSSSSSSSSFAPQGANVKGSMRETEKSARPPAKKQGTFFQWLDQNEKEKEQMEMLKREKMNEIYTQRMHDKTKKEQQQTSASQQHDDDDDL